MRESDRVRLAEAFRIGEQLRDSIWAGWSEAPLAVLLVTAEHEFLVRHPSPPADFSRAGYDPLLRGEIFSRERVFPTALTATFPLSGGVPVVVIGQPENTNLGSTAWVVTVLHEHFHQLQYSRPGYYAGVAALDLARGDSTGMWMLAYPFPYDSAAVRERFTAMAKRLAAAVEASRGNGAKKRLRAYLDARDELKRSLDEDDYRYLSFQLWQEGVARYTEYRIAETAARRYTPSAEFAALPDYQPFADVAAALRRGILDGLREADLGRNRRVSFYPVGAAIALLLDEAAPGWQERYLEERFTLDPYFDAER